MNEEPADIRIAAFADSQQSGFASGGALARNQTKPGGEVPRFPELAGITELHASLRHSSMHAVSPA